MTALDQMDAIELRVSLESATDGALSIADKVMEEIAANPRDLRLVTLASSYDELRKLQKRLRKALTVTVAG